MYLFAGVFLLAISSCTKEDSDDSSGTDSETGEAVEGTTVAEVISANASSFESSSDYTWDSSSVIAINLNGSSASASGTSGVTISGTTITITDAGNYSFTGTLSGGQIIVNADGALVRLILSGASITSSTNAPVFIKKAEKVILVLAEGTSNTLTDVSSYSDLDDDEPNAALYSKTDLAIYGEGSLTVTGNYNDGITSKDGLIIKSGTINVTASDDGIRGKDYLIVESGTINVSCGGDGFKSDNDDDSEDGYIYIEDGTINIVSSGGDGMAAETDVAIASGDITITSGGGSSKTVSSDTSTKGIKAGDNLVIEGNTISINSSDDALHSNAYLNVNDGTITISSGDDGIHSDTSLSINSGDITISKCYEGIESALLYINGGNISIVSSDDGINGAGGNDGSSVNGRPGQGSFSSSGNYYLYINGGYIYVNATGDGIDVNGAIVMTAGTVIIDGPTSSSNGALDYDSSFKISGGFLVAAGSSGMAQAPSTSSSQYSVSVTISKSAGTLFNIQSSDGNTNLLTFSPAKTYQSVVFSSPDLTKGSSYNIYYGGSCTGTETNGLYDGGTYSGGTKYASFTVSSVVTSVSSTGSR